jgi:molybdenum ABC transporter molybdate-binding protein
MSRIVLLLGASLVLLAGLFLSLSGGRRSSVESNGSSRSLLVYCAASNRAVVAAIVSRYEKEFDRRVDVQYGASQSLFSSLSVSQTGDLYLPADDSYIKQAREAGLVEEVLPIASMRAVLAVAKGNSKNIRKLDDLLKKDVRFVQANPEAAAIGKVCRSTLSQNGWWEKLSAVSLGDRTTVNDVANDIAIGAADAGFVYDVVVKSFPKLEAVSLPELKTAVSNVEVGVLKSTNDSRAALHFARYMTAEDRGLEEYKQFGFQTVRGDVWENVPELAVFAGSMLRPAIEDTIVEFEKREGAKVSRVYNGCGILVAQMKAGQHPDAYFACDQEFMKQVPDIFPESNDVSQNELVIMVQKGNPHAIKSLSDLSKRGLKVGIGHEKQCAMGWITQNTFREAGITKDVMENVAVQTPSGDMLVNQMQTGSLDAAVAYLSNAAGAGEFLDAIRIEGLPCSVATQPFAIAQDSPRPNITARLFEKLCSADSQSIFEAEGFRWLKSDEPR